MSDNMQSTDEILDDESPDAKATEAYEEVEEFDPFEGMSDEELDALCDEDDSLAGFGDVEPGFRSGFVALVGRPNAGKSTLLNACYGKKVAITSPVAQTTRRRMRAVVNRPGYQLVFVDTPGIHKPKDGLGSELNKSALFELNDVDVVAFLIDATKPIGRGDAWVAERVKNARSKKVLVLTKADEADPAQVMEQLKAAHELMEYDDEIVTSSVKNFNVDAFIETVAHFLPEGPRWFPEDMGTDASDETLVAEFVREKVLRRTRDEIPHSVGVICDALEQTKKVLRVHATIYVEREGQKGIIIGKGGEMIKHIGIDARRDLERIFGTQVFLELDVKVKAGWRRGSDSPFWLQRRGLRTRSAHGRLPDISHEGARARQDQAQRDRSDSDDA